MLPNIKEVVSAAIRNKRRLLLRYDSRSHTRVVEPHLLYRSENGALTMVAYQISGYHSSKRRGTFWRPFQLKKVDSVYVMNDVFETRNAQGYDSVIKLVKGEIVSHVTPDDSLYNFFKPAAYGPPIPAYLSPTPSVVMRAVSPTSRSQ
ncbi:MAG: WYL domain-containing protein [Gammaproteobacteria bacterium]|nr:WYL domain-containing protein [Gammaproteobacteria bacterium]